MNEKIWTLLIKRVSEGLSEVENSELATWLSQDEANADKLASMEKMLQLADNSFETYMPETAMAWEKMTQQLTATPKSNTVVRAFTRYRMVAAAAAVLLIFLVSYLCYQTPSEVTTTKQLAYIEIAATDSLKILFLPDSSKVLLNMEGTIRYPENFEGVERKVILNGEAYFEVQKDSAKAFCVYAGDAQIKVLGTSFNVKAYEEAEQVELSVIEGEVAFSEKNRKEEPIVLKANEIITYNKKTGHHKKAQVKNKKLKWWLKQTGRDIEKFFKNLGR